MTDRPGSYDDREGEVTVDEQEREELVGLAAALAGDPARAAELLGEVRVLSSKDSDVEEDGLPAARALLVQRFLRRRQPPAAPAEAAVELSPELDAVRLRLDQLAPLPRAALVLRERDQLTLGELVRVTERPVATVKAALTEAAGRLDAPPYQLDQVLAALPGPEPWAVQAAEQRWAARRRRTRGRVLLATMAAAALVTAASVLPGMLRPDPYVRAAGDWVYGFTTAPSPEFTPLGRTLSTTEDTLTLSWTGHRDRDCTLTLTTTDHEVPPEGRRLRLGDRPARLVAATDATYASLWWSVGQHTSGSAQCEQADDAELLLRLARLVRYGPQRVRLPFALPDLPSEDEVRLVFDYSEGSGAMVTPRGQLDNSPDTVYVSVPSLFDVPEGPPTGTTTVDGTTGRVYSDVVGQAVCWTTDGHTACVGAYPLQDPTARQRGRVLHHVIGTAKRLHVAPDLDDRATWFDAADALPH
jgi:hypothetical protein